MLQKDIDTLQDFSNAIEHEWLETNGIGGFSSSSIIGCHTRRYHGLLIAATQPPAERMCLVSKLDETIVVNSERFDLGTNDYGDAIHPQGYQFTTKFTRGLFPQFYYQAGNIKLRKTIGMIYGHNTVVIQYEVISAASAFTLELLPLLAVRGYHNLAHANITVNTKSTFNEDVFSSHLYEDAPTAFIKIPGARFEQEGRWYYNFNYQVEKYRGLEYNEDLFNPGIFSIELQAGDRLGIIISTENPELQEAFALLQQEENRRKNIIKLAGENETLQQLNLAADQFIVARGENLKTVIAGYHWFTDWGRDTMISLRGLTLSTGRYEDARKILLAFADSVSMGMLPNRFRDNGEPPEYNNVDGTLWYFIAIHKYLEATNDQAFVLERLLPVLKNIIDWHYKGTRYNIKADENGLLHAGEEGQQLTWMDARIGNWVVTPRMGKPVEIQALWFNCLKIFAGLLRLNRQQEDADKVEQETQKLQQHFKGQFWYSAGNYLFDCIDEQGNPDTTLRPNQLFAISLPYALLDNEPAIAVLHAVKEQLYTPVGLRTLPANNGDYKPVYGGDQWHRDAAYHQGTAWSWLLGPYIDAIIRVTGNRSEALQVIENFMHHLNEGCIGSVSEIFDADAPNHPRGCIAQAWGVAEILRVVRDYELYPNQQVSLANLNAAIRSAEYVS